MLNSYSEFMKCKCSNVVQKTRYSFDSVYSLSKRTRSRDFFKNSILFHKSLNF